MEQAIIISTEAQLRKIIRECLAELPLTASQEKEYLTPAEAMEALHCKATTLWKLKTEGHISYVRVGKRNGILYTRSSIQSYLKSRTVKGFANTHNQQS